MALIDDSPAGSVELQQRLVETVRHELAATATPGVAVALLLDGQPVVTAGVGFRDPEQTAALDPDAQLYIYSVTKSLIATVILQLVEQGQLALDMPVQTYLAQLPLATPVTLRQLLNHTGGLPDYGGLPAYTEALQADPTHPWTADDFLGQTLPRGLTFAPGQGWDYSNIGFLLLRRVIEAVLHTSLREAFQKRLFAPLGLQQTCVAQTLADAPQLTPGYSSFFSADDSLQDVRTLYHPGWVSHGVVIASAPELARLVDALFTGRLIGPHSLAAMLEPVLVPHTHPFFEQPAYGLGVMLDARSRYGLIAGHAGGGPGYSAGALHLHVHGQHITSVVLANCDQGILGLRIAWLLATTLADTFGS